MLPKKNIDFIGFEPLNYILLPLQGNFKFKKTKKTRLKFEVNNNLKTKKMTPKELAILALVSATSLAIILVLRDNLPKGFKFIKERQ